MKEKKKIARNKYSKRWNNGKKENTKKVRNKRWK